MSKNKKDEQFEEVKNHMKIGEELRSSMVKEKKLKAVDPKEAFRKFFIKVKDKLKLKPEMEAVIWKHLVAIKHDKPESFLKGIEHFGYKINN